jgi:dephospho-CoA kinase
MQTQASRDQRLKAADDLIQSEATLDDIRIKVAHLHDKYLQLSATVQTNTK